MDPKSVGSSTSFPDVRSIVTIFGNGQGELAPIAENSSDLRYSDTDARPWAIRTHTAFVQFRVLEPLPNPANWLSLSDLDFIVALNEFWTHRSVGPFSHDAMRRWVAAGGVLCSCGDSSMASPQPESFLNSLKFEKIATASVPTGKAVTDSLRLTELNDGSMMPVHSALACRLSGNMDHHNHNDGVLLRRV